MGLARSRRHLGTAAQRTVAPLSHVHALGLSGSALAGAKLVSSLPITSTRSDPRQALTCLCFSREQLSRSVCLGVVWNSGLSPAALVPVARHEETLGNESYVTDNSIFFCCDHRGAQR